MPSSAKKVQHKATAPAAPLRSMTGYALVRSQTTAGELTIALRSVNHRGLDLHFHHASELAPFENAMRDLLKQNIGRGHIEIRASLNKEEAAAGLACNSQRLRQYVALFQELNSELGLQAKPDLNALFSLPGVLDGVQEVNPLRDEFGVELESALAACIRELNAYREREGCELLRALETEVAELEEQAAEIAAIRSGAIDHFQNRLRERLQNLLGDSGLPESRLVEEAALLADKSDIQEELTRLTVHANELRGILERGGEVGKRLDFLLQEMNREANTTLSKTSGIGDAGLTITSLGLAIKANIERMREQALNLE
ncbi:MAG TPA: YicC/YloC family endoribonuclease [Bryobacteraceae bacterium]|nr:YicC/YloC family endoribonuclease [Bryobacteraceae bacterium]